MLADYFKRACIVFFVLIYFAYEQNIKKKEPTHKKSRKTQIRRVYADRAFSGGADHRHLGGCGAAAISKGCG